MELEYAILACIWIDDKLQKVKLQDIKPEFFSCREAAEQVIEYRQAGYPYDIIASKEHLGVELTARLMQALDTSAGLAMYDFYIARLKIRYYLKKLNTDGVTIEVVEQLLRATKIRGENEKLYNFQEDLHTYAEEVEKRSRNDAPKIEIGKYGIFSERLGYLRPGQSVVVGARSGIGKTQMLVNIFSHLISEEISCLYITAEITYIEICDRLMALNSNFSQWDITNGRIQGSDWVEFNKTINDKLSGKQSVIYQVSRFDIAKIRNLIAQYKPQVVFVDFLQCFQLASKNKSDTRASVLSDIVNELKAIALEKNVVTIAASQLNRGAADDAPTNANFKESGGIEESADKCILIYDEIINDYGRTVKVKISKNRSGRSGDEFEFCFENRSGAFRCLGIAAPKETGPKKKKDLGTDENGVAEPRQNQFVAKGFGTSQAEYGKKAPR